MLQSPSTSPPTTPFALIGCAFGILGIVHGVKIIIKRETKAGPRGGPYITVTGKNAIQIGIGFILFSLSFVVFGILGLIEIYETR